MNTSLHLTIIEWSGSSLGLVGAYLLAFRNRVSHWGWVAFLVSNVLMMVLASSAHLWGLFAMQLGFMGSSLIGIYRAFRDLQPAFAPTQAAAGVSTGPAPVYLASGQAQLSVKIDKNGFMKESAVTWDTQEMAPEMVARWLEKHNLVAHPAGFDFKVPIPGSVAAMSIGSGQ